MPENMISQYQKQEFSYIYDIGNRLHIFLQSFKNDIENEEVAPKIQQTLMKLFEQVFVLNKAKIGLSFSINEGEGPWNMMMAAIGSEISPRHTFIYFASEIQPGKFVRFIYTSKENWRENYDL